MLLGPNSETVLSGRPPEREIYQSSTTNLPSAPNAPAPRPANQPAAPAETKSEAAARAAAFAARGAEALNKPLGNKPETWTGGKCPPPIRAAGASR